MSHPNTAYISAKGYTAKIFLFAGTDPDVKGTVACIDHSMDTTIKTILIAACSPCTHGQQL